MTIMNFVGSAKRLEDLDLPKIGHEIGVGEDEIHAILEVEASGSGFDSKNRPKMLFEPHIFWRELGPGSQRNEASAHGLAYSKWKRSYPSESYTRLGKALAINPKAALRSCSWGLGQLMGFNHSLCGYDSVEAMVEAFKEDEESHLRAMVKFIITAGLDDELRNHDWKGFARGYNGSSYAANGYHTKLESAYRKWAKIKDTPWLPGLPQVIEPPSSAWVNEIDILMLSKLKDQRSRILAILSE